MKSQAEESESEAGAGAGAGASPHDCQIPDHPSIPSSEAPVDGMPWSGLASAPLIAGTESRRCKSRGLGSLFKFWKFVGVGRDSAARDGGALN